MALAKAKPFLPAEFQSNPDILGGTPLRARRARAGDDDRGMSPRRAFPTATSSRTIRASRSTASKRCGGGRLRTACRSIAK
ncbi:MAG TPA: hypothetical protein PKA74_19120 [Bauldia sp.]|nr:hypothetical protein [Bauldia sp.]